MKLFENKCVCVCVCVCVCRCVMKMFQVILINF